MHSPIQIDERTSVSVFCLFFFCFFLVANFAAKVCSSVTNDTFVRRNAWAKVATAKIASNAAARQLPLAEVRENQERNSARRARHYQPLEFL